MRGYKTIVCEVCGSTALVPAKRQIPYCNNPSCEKQAKQAHRDETQKKYEEKRRALLEEQARLAKAKLEQDKAKIEEDNEKTRNTDVPINVRSEFAQVKEMFRKKEVNTTALDKIEIWDIREIARQLGTVRFRLIEMLQKESEKIKQDEKGDITLLHAFELEDLSKEQVWEMYQKAKDRRTGRRVNKYRYDLIYTLLNGILVKNPDKFVVTAMQDARSNADFKDVINELKKDKELYEQPRRIDTEENKAQ